MAFATLLPMHYLTVAQLAAKVASRELSPVTLTESFLARIAALDNQLDAFITLTADLARQQARQAEQDIARGHYRGPLHGIPFALKDIYETAGIRTTACSKTLVNHVPVENATTVQRLLDAGAVLLGKLVTHEFASGGPSLDLPWPPARNPWNTAHFTGGSSSGAGAAVAAGFAPYALGTDTGGSIRIPSAYCGLAGIKPTYGRVSRRGVMPNSYTFDHCGPMAWTAEDCAMVLQVIAGHDPRDPASARQAVPDFLTTLNAGVCGLRVGLPRHLWEDEAPVAREAQAAFDQALAVLRELGASMDAVRMRKRQQYNDVRSVISRSELLSIYDRDLRERPGDFGADFLARNLAACMYTAGDVVRAQRERRRMVAEIEPLFAQVDVLLTPAPSPAPRLDSLLGGGFADKWENPNLYVPFSLLGLPAMVVCTGYTDDGLPLSMQIVGRPFDEATVLRVGHAYERATRWRERRPPLAPGALKPVLRDPPAPALLPAMDVDTRRVLDTALARAGYPLNDIQRGMIDRVAPQVLAAAQRLPRDHGLADEPAATFHFREG